MQAILSQTEVCLLRGQIGHLLPLLLIVDLLRKRVSRLHVADLQSQFKSVVRVGGHCQGLLLEALLFQEMCHAGPLLSWNGRKNL